MNELTPRENPEALLPNYSPNIMIFGLKQFFNIPNLTSLIEYNFVIIFVGYALMSSYNHFL